MIKIYSFLFFLVFTNIVFASNIDSLELQLNKVNETNKAEILVQLSKAYWTISPSKGMFYANEAVKFAEKYNDQSQKAKALLYGGVNAWFMGLYDEAIEYYQKSLTIAYQLNDKRLCAYNLNNLGMINAHLNNYEKAINNYSESSAIMEEIGDKIEYAKITNNIAELNLILGNIDEAYAQHLSVLDIIENSDEQVFLIWLYNDIGMVLKKKGNIKLALQYFYKSLDLSNKIDNTLGKSKTMNLIGEVYLLQKEYEKAKEYFYNGLKYAKQTDAKDNILDTYKNISEYYSTIENYKKSLEYYQLFKQLSDSLLNDNKIRTIIEMQARYDLESVESENHLLQKNIEIHELTFKKNRIQLIILIVSLLLTILLIILIYNRLMINNKKNKLINNQKNQLSTSLIELQKLNKVLHQQKEEIQTSQKELESVNKLLAETNATKDKFYSIIAHDLKSPFNSMLGFSEILDDNFDDYDKEQQKKFIGNIHQGLKDNYNLLENLLQWANSQKGTIRFEPQKIDLFAITNTTCNIFHQTALEKSIELINQIPESTYIQADVNMVSTIIRNLVSNAIKFTHRGGEVRIDANLAKDNNFIEIMVKDNGSGISEDIKSKLFKITENISTKGTEKETGTGLGLLLCKEFVEKHKGKIWVESESGKGSSFYFTIPYYIE